MRLRSPPKHLTSPMPISSAMTYTIFGRSAAGAKDGGASQVASSPANTTHQDKFRSCKTGFFNGQSSVE